MFKFLKTNYKFLPLYRMGVSLFKHKKIECDNFTVLKNIATESVVACHSSKNNILIAHSSIIKKSYLDMLHPESVSDCLLNNFIDFFKLINVFDFEKTDVSSAAISYYVNNNGHSCIVEFLRFNIYPQKSDSFMNLTGIIIIYDSNGCNIIFENIGSISKKNFSIFFDEFKLTHYQLFNDLDKLDILFRKKLKTITYTKHDELPEEMKIIFLNKNYPLWKTVGIPTTPEEVELIKMLHY